MDEKLTTLIDYLTDGDNSKQALAMEVLTDALFDQNDDTDASSMRFDCSNCFFFSGTLLKIYHEPHIWPQNSK